MATTFFAPLALDPYSSMMRRPGVMTVDPDVAVSIPAVVARDPHPTLMSWSGNDFDWAWRRWTDADDDLRIGNADREE
jgi:hypothetical protein